MRHLHGVRLIGAATALLLVGAFGIAAAPVASAAPNCGGYLGTSVTVSLTSTTVTPGSRDTVSASGFAKSGQPGAGGSVTIEFYSTPTSLGTAQIQPDGTISKVVTIPAQATPGQHVIQVSGPDGCGQTAVGNTELNVTNAAVLGNNSAQDNATGSLPFTGADVVSAVVAGLLLVMVGSMLVFVLRRRRGPQLGV